MNKKVFSNASLSKRLSNWIKRVPGTSKYIYKRKGWCSVCNKNTQFEANNPWLRDHYMCLHCGSLPRERALHHVLDEKYSAWERCYIHEGSPANGHIADKAIHYSASQYYPDKPLGTLCGAFHNENIEQLSFPDNTFDLFITLDVLEHVFFPDRAIQDMIRVIRPGGACVFTVPVHKNLINTRQRASMVKDRIIENRMPPVYHGNPIGDGRSLVTWDYGADFPAIIERWIGRPVIRVNQVNEYYGIEGEFLDVFIISK